MENGYRRGEGKDEENNVKVALQPTEKFKTEPTKWQKIQDFSKKYNQIQYPISVAGTQSYFLKQCLNCGRNTLRLNYLLKDIFKNRKLFFCRLDNNSIVNIGSNILTDFLLLTAEITKTKLRRMCHSIIIEKEV